MIYKIKMDDISIYGNASDLNLISPKVNIELNSAGSLDFSMPITHKYYTLPKTLVSDVEVYEEDNLIWFGRVLEVNTSMNKNKQIYCEGALAYFNDSVQRPQIFDTTTVHAFFQTVIENHNSQVPINRRFTIGDVTVPNVEIYRELNYEKTKEVLEKMCLNAEGGYFFFRKENGVNYIDWLEELPYDSTQTVQFGLNIVDISKYINASNIRTAILPVGKDIDGVRLTIESVNQGLDYLDSDAVEIYGRITEVVEFQDIGTADELLSVARGWLANQEYGPLTIKCDAAELHYFDNTLLPFGVGQRIRVYSIPHGIDQILPLTAIDINLDSAVKKISIGTPDKRDLTEIYKTGESDGNGGYVGSGGGGSSGGGGGGLSITIDDQMSLNSRNPVENRVITQAIQNSQVTIDSALSTTSTNPVQNKVITAALSSTGTSVSNIVVSSVLTLDANDWDPLTLEQTVTFAHDVFRRNVIDPTISETEDWISNEVLAVSETSASITFSCKSVPSTDLTFRVTSMGVNGDGEYSASINQTVSLLAANWVGNAAPYTQTVNCANMSSTIVPIISQILSNTVSTGLTEKDQWSRITKAVSGAGTVTFYCYENKPTIDLTANVKYV